MLKTLTLKNFTVFSVARFQFGSRLNVFIGENGMGKTHLLKLLYSILAASWEQGRKPGAEAPSKNAFQPPLADKLVNVFRPESLGRLARRKQGRERCDIQTTFSTSALNIDFGFATNSKSEVAIDRLPGKWIDVAPAYLPTRELLSIYPNFVSMYQGHYLEFEETWRDTCLLLGAPSLKGPRESRAAELLEPIEAAMGGKIVLDNNGRFYLNVPGSGKMEIPLVAEGLRKLGMLARLVATGALIDKGYLFWDEPEANLNPRVIRKVASTIVDLANSGIQVFVATHSLFLLREMEILLAQQKTKPTDVRFFGLHSGEGGIEVAQGAHIDDAGDIAALDESLMQSDRYLETLG
jgi:energy-coupling factor transporter ATP-binding protein EcfA2